ncbi:MAG: alpha/beta hydrolase [Rhodospirillales bacterium]
MQVDGRSVFVAHGGSSFDPSRPAVVLLHGAGMDHSAWAWQSRALAQRGSAVLAIDLPGHGGSQGPPLDSIPTLADWLVRLLDAAGIAAAALAGHSLGALIALDTAARFPQRVRAIALIGAAARMPVHPALLQAAQDNRPEAIAMVNLWGHGQRAQLGGCPVPGLWMTGLGQRLLERAGPGVLHAGLVVCDGYRDGAERAAEVPCPARVIVGARDLMTPAKAGRALAAMIPNAVASVIPAAGHMLMIERPGETLDALLATF